jgi:hypothetical protein
MMAAIEDIRSELGNARKHERYYARQHHLNIGDVWLTIKADPMLNKVGGIEALQPFLPLSPQVLNECAVGADGRATGDLEKGELWVKHTGYKLRNEYEPYLMAEIVRAYRSRLKQKPPSRTSPLAIIEGKLFVRNLRESFPNLGSAILSDNLQVLMESPR